MPKSSRHKSHRHSKHSSKETREYSESDDDVKKKELSKEETLAKISRISGSSEKRKDPPSHSNGVMTEEYVGSKRRREKEREKGGGSAVSDRWIGGGAVEVELKGEISKADGEKTLKSKSGDSKSKSSRAHDSVGEKKEEGKGVSKVDSKRKHEKESSRKEAQLGKDFIESKDKVIVVEKEKDKEKVKMVEKEKVKMVDKEKEKEKEKERKIKDSVHEFEDEVVDIGDAIFPAVVFGEEQGGKHGRENNVWPVLDERVPESEKEIEKRRSKRDGAYEKVKYENHVKESEDRHVSSRGEHANDGKYKDEKYKYGSHGDKHREDLDREAKYKDEQKYKDASHGDKHREELDKEAKYKDEQKYKDVSHGDKHCEDFDREAKYKDDQKYKDLSHGDKHREDLDRGVKYKDEQKYKDVSHGDKHREDLDREAKYKDEEKYKDVSHGDKHRGDLDREAKYKDEQKYKDVSHGDKHREDFDRDARYKDEQKYKHGSHGDKHREEFDRDARYKDEQKYKVGSHGDKYREDFDREARYDDEQKYKDGSHVDKHREDFDRETRYKDEQKYKDGSHGDKHREDFDRDVRYKDEKYAEDVDRERRYREAKYRESSDKVSRHKDDKYREDVNREKRPRDDKYREGGDRDIKYRDAKYREDAEKDYRRRVDRYHEDGNRDDRQKDDWYFEDYSRDSRIREEKNWEDAGRDGRRREEKQRDDIVKDKRLRDTKYQDERLIRDVTNENSDLKRSRDESEVAEFRNKRLTNRDGTPNFDDRGTRYKDDRGKRRAGDKEEYDDIRAPSTKEQHLDIEKNSTIARVESVGYRGRSSLRDADNMVISPNHVRRGDSPSYRLLKQEESRFRESTHSGRERRDVTPSKEYAGISGVTDKVSSLKEKSLPKDDRQADDASIEKRSKEDPLISSFQIVDRSPSTASNDRRNLRRADVRRSLDGEDSGQRSGGSKEIKDYYGRDNRGNRELPNDNLPRDEISQPDTENFSAASPFPKPSHFNNNSNTSRSHLPPTPFRGGPDRPFDDDNRNKLNRRRRMDPNMGRGQANAWRGVPNWPPPVANGFVPFQHGPPPLGFHPVMPQFPSPSMFSVRPSMEPFHIHDSDRFPGHVRPFGWDVNNPIFGDDPHIYGRVDWDHSRGLISGRGWETSRDIWKGQNTGVSAELSAVPQKDDFSAQGDDTNQPSVQVESVEIDHLSDVLEMDTAEAQKAIAEDMIEYKIRDDAYISCAYLSMLDISEDLSQHELYSQYTKLVGMDQNEDPEEDEPKLLIMEEDIDALGKDSERTSSASLFCTVNDSVFQSAMSMYKKLKEEVMTFGQEKIPSPTAENAESALPSISVEAASNDEQSLMEVFPTLQQKEAEIAAPDFKKVKMEASLGFTCEEIDKQFSTDGGVKSEPIASLNEVKMEISDSIVEDISLSSKKAIMDSTNDNGNEGQNLKDGKFVPLLFSDVSAEVESEGVIESGLVNLSRIHLSPESTH